MRGLVPPTGRMLPAVSAPPLGMVHEFHYDKPPARVEALVPPASRNQPESGWKRSP